MSDSTVAGTYTQSHVRYYHPDRGWTRDPEGATLRIQSRVELDVQSLADVKLQEPKGDGSWNTVETSQSPDDPERQGLVCYAHPIRFGQQDRIAFFAPQPLPRGIWKDLPKQGVDWDWQNFQGDALGHPARTGLEWHLPKKQAQALWKAMQTAGWKMLQRLPLLDEAYALAEDARTLSERVTRLIEISTTPPAIPAQLLDWRERNTAERLKIQQRARTLTAKQRQLEGYWNQAGGEEHDQALRYLKRSATMLALVRRRLSDLERIPLKTVPDVLAELALQRAVKGLQSHLDDQGLHLGTVNGQAMVLGPDLTLRLRSEQ